MPWPGKPLLGSVSLEEQREAVAPWGQRATPLGGQRHREHPPTHPPGPAPPAASEDSQIPSPHTAWRSGNPKINSEA